MTDLPPPAHPGQVVHIVDDDDAFRASLVWLIESQGLETRDYPSAEAFLQAPEDAPGGCLIADIAMPGMNGLELHARLAEEGRTMPTIIITGHGDLPLAVEAFRGGAVDFLEKPLDDAYLLERITLCLEQGRRNALHRDAQTRYNRRLHRLTAREREVFDLIVAGLLNKQIAERLGISMKTVEVHRSRVMEKMEVQTLAELVRASLLGREQPAG